MSFFPTNPVKQIGLPLVAASVVVCGFAAAKPAQALELTNRYSVSAALGDEYGKYGSGHVMTGKVFGRQYVTTAASDLFWEEYDDGTAKLVGTVFDRKQVNNGNANPNYWDVNVNFVKRTEVGTGGPKKELKSSAYSVNGGPIDPSTWDFYDFSENLASTLTGFGGNIDGRVLTIQDATNGKYPVQVGFGANGKNANFGMSTWFHAYEDGEKINGHADFNVDFQEVPTPAAGLAWLVTSGMAIARRRKQERDGLDAE